MTIVPADADAHFRDRLLAEQGPVQREVRSGS